MIPTISHFSLETMGGISTRVNFEDRRCIDKVAFCAMFHGPSSVCCLEFEQGSRKIDVNNFNNRFCVDCAHYEDILGISICSRPHRPGIACPAFRRKSETLETATQKRDNMSAFSDTMMN